MYINILYRRQRTRQRSHIEKHLLRQSGQQTTNFVKSTSSKTEKHEDETETVYVRKTLPANRSQPFNIINNNFISFKFKIVFLLNINTFLKFFRAFFKAFSLFFRALKSVP